MPLRTRADRSTVAATRLCGPRLAPRFTHAVLAGSARLSARLRKDLKYRIGLVVALSLVAGGAYAYSGGCCK